MSHVVVHLHKGGVGMAAHTACGRSILRTPLSTDWEGFKLTPDRERCAKCATSKQAALNERRDADRWEPLEPDAWKLADDRILGRA